MKKKQFNKKRTNQKINYIFIILCLFFVAAFYFNFLNGPKINTLENRKYFAIPKISLKAIYDGKFQEDVEKAFTDRIPLSENIKYYNSNIKNAYSLIFKKLVGRDNCNGYTEIATNIYIYKCQDHFMEKPYYDPNNVQPITMSYKQIANKHDLYGYFIESDRSILFNQKINHKLASQIAKMINWKKFSYFKINSYQDFDNYFYKTDHHWNHKGSYRGYQEILKLLKPQDQPHVPLKEQTFDVYFNGSRARIGKIFNSKEKFTVYQFDLNKKYATTINNNLKSYGKRKEYNKNSISKKVGTNHYGQYYGFDYGEIIYDFNQPQENNLLIISNSYSNSINELVASHFNKTHILDFRHHPNKNLELYIKENRIDKIIIIGDSSVFSEKEFMYQPQGGR